MIEIIEPLERANLLLLKKIMTKTYGGWDWDKRQKLAEARELLQKAITLLLLCQD